MQKKINYTPFNRQKTPPKQNIFLTPFIWFLSWIITRSGRLKIHKKNMKGLKPPYIVFGTHHAFLDFCITPLALFPHRANYISELEGFEYYGEWLYRQMGCLGTRKFILDTALVRNIKKIIARKGIIVIYPEARYANVGTSAPIPLSTAKIAKYLAIPVVGLSMKGNYLQSPIWNLKKRKGVRLETILEQIITAQELKQYSPNEIQEKIESFLTYDEYQWQYDQKMHINYKKRAEGIEKVLYQCYHCKAEFYMETSGSILHCANCDSTWTMNTLGQLAPTDNGTPIHIPIWYEWQREQVKNTIDTGEYLLEQKIKIEALPNAINFIDLGIGYLKHDQTGFKLTFTDSNQTEETTLTFTPKETFSIHTEYDYRGKGVCITLSTPDNTYFLYPTESGFNPTKIQFATEYIYQKTRL